MNDAPAAADTWALVLAGGDGTRLRDLTTLLAGQPIPKQYCRITGDRSMLEATLARIAPVVPAERTLVIVNRDHLALATQQLAALPPSNVLVQPCNRDTGPGILWSLLELERRRPGARVAVFPSDHYVADDDAFRACVRRAVGVVDQFPDKIALLGIEPDHAAPGYGYVVPARRLPTHDATPAFRVATFREKPDRALARRILRRGGLWNSLVMVLRVARMLQLIEAVRPAEFAALRAASEDRAALEELYASTAAWNLSSDFLAHVPNELVVLRAERTGWSDWGTRQAIERTFAALNRRPPWHADSPRPS
ncbi:MAG: sugar phosphate nucleotidyltransferase [Thermodesulfobacteriota bacterium]